MNKKGISPVVAMALLLVVAVVAVVSFQNWFSTYQSTMFVDAETQSDSAAKGSIKIEQLIGNSLYVINNIRDNLSVNILKIGSDICNLTNLSLGMNIINVTDCIDNLTTTTPDIVLISENNIVEKKIVVNVKTSSSQSLSNPLNCSNLNGGTWIEVPGNVLYGTSDFCVMKYEAKLSGGFANSIASNTPWTSITWQDAQTECKNLGADYHLITDAQWLTIARNVENTNLNWNSSVVGTGFIFSGHNDNGPPNKLAADTDDNNGYYGTNDNLSSCDGVYSNYPIADDVVTGRACAGQKRTLILQNGEVIWDLSGNVWEWVNDSMVYTSRYHGGDQQWMSYSSDDGTGKVASLVPALQLPSNGWNANNGMGRYYDGYNITGAYNSINELPDSCTGYCSNTVAFLRGGDWYIGSHVGAFTLLLNSGPSISDTNIGFRCAYTP